MSKLLNDPLEQAKMRAARQPPPPPPVVPPPTPIAKDAGVVVPVKRYEVVTTRRISMFGQVIMPRVGEVISDTTHGPKAIELMMAHGIELKELP